MFVPPAAVTIGEDAVNKDEDRVGGVVGVPEVVPASLRNGRWFLFKWLGPITHCLELSPKMNPVVKKNFAVFPVLDWIAIRTAYIRFA